jgi:hypothetical protein
MLGTLIGFTIATQSVEAAGEVNVTLMWGGIKVSMLASLFGVLTLAFASFLWGAANAVAAADGGRGRLARSRVLA